MSLRDSYTLFAPLYDFFVGRASMAARRRSLAFLGDARGQRILLDGVGSGLDLPLLPPGAEYFGLDLTPAMLARARRRAGGVILIEGDAQCLPLRDGSVDVVILHLILAVVPHPERALAEAARITRPGGRLIIFDKFLKPDKPAPLRRFLSPLLARIATRLDVVFEDLLIQQPRLILERDEPALAGGWFRHIVLRVAAPGENEGPTGLNTYPKNP